MGVPGTKTDCERGRAGYWHGRNKNANRSPAAIIASILKILPAAAGFPATEVAGTATLSAPG
ncbi:MAG: hypothetical protein D6160_09305 [Ketobacter sp.]|nr:MAG: hypothetical protein D6160_09305 [Ketobacter sp.]